MFRYLAMVWDRTSLSQQEAAHLVARATGRQLRRIGDERLFHAGHASVLHRRTRRSGADSPGRGDGGIVVGTLLARSRDLFSA